VLEELDLDMLIGIDLLRQVRPLATAGASHDRPDDCCPPPRDHPRPPPSPPFSSALHLPQRRRQPTNQPTTTSSSNHRPPPFLVCARQCGCEICIADNCLRVGVAHDDDAAAASDDNHGGLHGGDDHGGGVRGGLPVHAPLPAPSTAADGFLLPARKRFVEVPFQDESPAAVKVKHGEVRAPARCLTWLRSTYTQRVVCLGFARRALRRATLLSCF
jgi:hypothetical protein